MKQLRLQLRYILPLWLILLLTNWLPDNRFTIRFRGWCASPFFRSCGKGLELGGGLTILNSFSIDIGNNVYIAKGTWLNGLGNLIIEDEVVIAPYVVVSTMQHVFKNNSVRFGGSIPGRVIIGKGSWIAAHVSVKCGVKIGKGSVIGANSFVVKDTNEGSIYGGVPAKFIKNNKNEEFSFKCAKELLDPKNDK